LCGNVKFIKIKFIKISSTKSCELDPIPTKILKQCITPLLPTITKIINKSLSSGTVPEQFKHAIVTPILKKEGLDTDFKNYRPISNLPYMSKLLEKVVDYQINQHTTTHNLDEKYQSAYRVGRSTETAVLKVQNDILLELDKGNAVLIALLDLSAAFDTVDHEILLNRLKSTFGMNGKVLSWFKSYFNGRTQSVNIKGTNSPPHTLTFSVPKGSIMGAPLYCKHTRPVGDIVQLFEILFHVYADDTQFYKGFSPSNIESQMDAINKLQVCTSQITSWMTANKLKINEAKTEFMIIALRAQKQKMTFNELNINGTVIPSSSSVRNLGADFDFDNCQWQYM